MTEETYWQDGEAVAQRGKIADLESQLAAKNRELIDWKREADRQHEKYIAVEMEIAEAQRENAALKETCNELRSELEPQAQLCAQLRTQALAFRDELTQAKQRITDTESVGGRLMKAMSDEIDCLRKRIAELEAKTV